MSGFELTESASFEITKEQYDQMQVMLSGKNPLTKKATSAKTLSQAYGFGENYTKIPVDEMFDPARKIYPTLDPSKNLNEQTVDLVRLAVYSVTCACLAQTCTQNANAGCPIFRDVESMKVMSRSFELVEKDGRHFMKMQFKSTEQNPDSVEKALELFTKNVPFLDTGPFCGSGANCKYGCTFHDPQAQNIKALVEALKHEEKPEGVLQWAYETVLRQVSRVIGNDKGDNIYSNRFEPAIDQKDGKIAIIGGGPAGALQALKLAQKGYEVHLYDPQEFVGGATNDLIPPDKSDLSLSAEHTRLLKKAGVNLHMKTKICEEQELTDWDKKNGVKSVSLDELKEQGFDAISYSFGIYDNDRARGLGSTPGADSKDVLPLADFLRQTNAYRNEMIKGISSGKFENAQEYYKQNPLVLDINNQQITLEELAQSVIFDSGVGYSGHDSVRTKMQLFELLPEEIRSTVEVHWQARSLNVDSDKPWPEQNPKKDKEPAVKMIKYLQSQDDNTFREENLTAIQEIHKKEDGSIKAITFVEREVTNPHIAEVNPAKAEYKNKETYTIDFEEQGKRAFVITATGYDVKKDHPLFEQVGIKTDGKKYPTENYHVTYLDDSNIAIFAGGNLSQDKRGLPDEVVNAYERGMVAAVHIDNYMQKAMAVDPDNRKAIYETNRENIITSSQAFGKRDMASNMNYDLSDLILNRSVGK